MLQQFASLPAEPGC